MYPLTTKGYLQSIGTNNKNFFLLQCWEFDGWHGDNGNLVGVYIRIIVFMAFIRENCDWHCTNM